MNNLEKIARVINFTDHESATTKLLETDDWSKITPEQLQQYIDDDYTADWIKGYDVGPSPLTNALIQEASPEIIAILIAARVNVNAPTILESGKEITPLGIVRSQAATHENMQKELMLLRAGAKDDIIDWLEKNINKLQNLDWMFEKEKRLHNQLQFLGYKEGAKVFQCGPSYTYIKEKAGKIWDEEDIDIYDKSISFNMFSGPEPEWLNNELGTKFAKEFFEKCEQLSFNVAMYEYYTYLASVYFFTDNKQRAERISQASTEFRDKHFSSNDWDKLINITSNITGKAEYNKMKEKRFPETSALK